MNHEIHIDVREQLLRSDEVREMISMRAYEIFVSRGGEPGHEAEDWLQAETEILTILIEEQDRLAQARSRTISSEPSAPVSSAPEPASAQQPAPLIEQKPISATPRTKSKTSEEKKSAKKAESKAESKLRAKKSPGKKEKKRT